MMKYEQFTMKTREALAMAQQIAMAKSHTLLSPLHLLAALSEDKGGLTETVLKRIGANLNRIREVTEGELDQLPKGASTGQIMLDPASNEVLLDAMSLADKMGDECLGPEHLLLSLATVESYAREVLSLHPSVTPEKIQNALKHIGVRCRSGQSSDADAAANGGQSED